MSIAPFSQDPGVALAQKLAATERRLQALERQAGGKVTATPFATGWASPSSPQPITFDWLGGSVVLMLGGGRFLLSGTATAVAADAGPALVAMLKWRPDDADAARIAQTNVRIVGSRQWGEHSMPALTVPVADDCSSYRSRPRIGVPRRHA